MTMPQKFQEIQSHYADEFSAFKPDKRLYWLPHLGTVSLELQLQDRAIEAKVLPLEAALIGLFEQKDVWNVNELLSSVGSSVDKSSVTRALNTWVELGVLKEEDDGEFKLLEVVEEGLRPSTSRLAPAVVEEQPTALTVQQQQAEQMKVFWRFIEGMLTSLGTLPLDRIQTMLKLAPGYDRTIDQLAMFMEAARREGLVTVQGGMWKLNR